MSTTIKKFKNKELNVSIDTHIDGKEVWTKGHDVALALGYKRPGKAIIDHIKDDEIRKVQQKALSQNGTVVKTMVTLINEPGIYRLIFSTKLESAERFKTWVFSEVLPSIRKYGHYRMFNNPKSLAFKIEDEYDLHTKVVQFIRRFYPEILITAGLGENQDTKDKPIKSFKKGYMKGQPNLIIQNLHKHYNGLCIELISDQQKQLI